MLFSFSPILLQMYQEEIVNNSWAIYFLEIAQKCNMFRWPVISQFHNRYSRIYLFILLLSNVRQLYLILIIIFRKFFTIKILIRPLHSSIYILFFIFNLSSEISLYFNLKNQVLLCKNLWEIYINDVHNFI